METLVKVNHDELINFINHDLLLNRMQDNPVTFESNLIESGVIDSLSLMQLVTHIEKEYAIEVSDWDVTPDNFQSVKSIVQYIEKQIENK